MTQKGYLIAEPSVSDPATYEIYKSMAQAAIAQYGGRYLVRGGEVAVLEGERTPSRMVVVEFDSPEAARRFYDSPEYKAAREVRQSAACMNMLVVSGVENLV